MFICTCTDLWFIRLRAALQSHKVTPSSSTVPWSFVSWAATTTKLLPFTFLSQRGEWWRDVCFHPSCSRFTPVTVFQVSGFWLQSCDQTFELEYINKVFLYYYFLLFDLLGDLCDVYSAVFGLLGISLIFISVENKLHLIQSVPPVLLANQRPRSQADSILD